ncbi:hypothetical protein GEMRC1_007900 [Eukaryota sp. GEM-RC1]
MITHARGSVFESPNNVEIKQCVAQKTHACNVEWSKTIVESVNSVEQEQSNVIEPSVPSTPSQSLGPSLPLRFGTLPVETPSTPSQSISLPSLSRKLHSKQTTLLPSLKKKRLGRDKPLISPAARRTSQMNINSILANE